ncbi:hypothetical protein EC973_003078 [Apophysomyces ossiformis]|uniref:ER membrane protein complex subunit 7 beta-sandwich domain-containing protein n=1 Tax=Apophysomyces ossiformis TaxID=679940 RepID=A0A8H7BRP2_9FUNG|nr:hypothetical protein EC973_003078 [Apophysomyces ossiformis]
MEVQSIDYIFPQLRVDVQEETVRAAYTGLGLGWDHVGSVVNYPVEWRAKAEAEYFMERQGFNVMGLFKNPMFLMIGFSAVMMFVLPKMMANLDPEAMNEFTQSQKDAQKTLSELPSLSQMFSQASQQQQQQQQQRHP